LMRTVPLLKSRQAELLPLRTTVRAEIHSADSRLELEAAAPLAQEALGGGSALPLVDVRLCPHLCPPVGPHAGRLVVLVVETEVLAHSATGDVVEALASKARSGAGTGVRLNARGLALLREPGLHVGVPTKAVVDHG